MTHDPLCRAAPAQESSSRRSRKGIGTIWCECDLISEVRADERSRWLSPYFSEEYHRGYRQAEADFRKSSEPNNT